MEKRNNAIKKVLAFWFAYRHPKTPIYVKILVILAGGYAFSAIEIIPDRTPVVGYLDDIILLPLAIFLAVKLIPKSVLAETRLKADEWFEQKIQKGQDKAGIMLLILVWMLTIIVIVNFILKAFIVCYIQTMG